MQRKLKCCITDFGHGLITKKIGNSINNLKVEKFINCQANSSNYGFNKFTKYTNAKMLSCDEDEYRLSLGERSEKLQRSINNKLNKFKKIKMIVIGKQGSYTIERNKVDFKEIWN